MENLKIARRAVARTLVYGAIFLAFGPAHAAKIVVNFTGITSTGEGAYLRQTDFPTGTTTYPNEPVYTDIVQGSFTIDTSKLPVFDPFEYESGYYNYSSALPGSTFAAAQFTSNGYFPVGVASETATLTYPVSNPDFASLSVQDYIDRSSSSTDSNGTVRSAVDTEVRTLSLAWGSPLPLTQIDGLILPDFTQINNAAFGSYLSRNRYVVDETFAPDGTILTRNQLEWTLTHGRSAGQVTSVSVQVLDVPEPATWVTMIIGFGLVGAAIRGRTTRFVAA